MKRVRIAISLFLLLGVLMASFATAQGSQIQPRYVGIAQMISSLQISSAGAATCTGRVTLKSGYTVDVTVELQRDEATIKTWTNSGSGVVSAGGTYYVTSGHDYVVTTVATVYDSSGKIVEVLAKDSIEKSF